VWRLEEGAATHYDNTFADAITSFLPALLDAATSQWASACLMLHVGRLSIS
jgi:hypothetical protein